MNGEREAAIIAAYRAASSSKRLAAMLVEYRCANRRGCLLLHVWQAPGVRLYYRSAYKKSSARNRMESAPSARAKRTSDGDRHWNAHAGLLEDLTELTGDAGLMLQCDHVRAVIDGRQVGSDAESARPGSPTRRIIA